MRKSVFDRVVITIAVVMMFVLAGIGGIYYLTEFRMNRLSKGTIPDESDLKTLQEKGMVYDHVVIFGVDGAGGYFDLMNTPGFDSVFKGTLDASVTYKGMSQFPTISAQNWGSMIHGVRSEQHKLTNDITEVKKYTDTKYPSFFKVYAENHPDDVASMYSIVQWKNINYGIIEDIKPQLVKINIDDVLGKNNLSSEEKTVKVCEQAIDIIKTQDPKILFTHFDCVDSAGHAFGWGKPEFEKAMTVADNCIGRIYQACMEKGWGGNTLFICIADHGHEPWGGHGSNNPSVRYVTFAVAGGKGNVIKGEPEHFVTQDMASVVLYALGEKQPDSWTSKVPHNMFKGLE